MAIAMKNQGVIWYNGEFVPWADAKLHVVSHGLHYASSVFEGVRAYQGKIFKMKEHNARFINSAKLLDFEIPYTLEELNQATIEVLKRNHLQDAYIRPVAWCGDNYMGVGSLKCKVNTAIAAWSWPVYYPEEIINQGIKVCLADFSRPHPRTSPTQAKAAGLYMIGSISKNKAERNGFHDALLLDWRGHIAECTGANIFLVINHELHTPITEGFLNGITRQTVMQLAKDLGYNVKERYINYEELAQASEVFITGTAVEVAPIGQIEQYQFAVGEVTKKLRAAYLDLVNAKI